MGTHQQGNLVTAYKVGPRGETQPVNTHPNDPLTPKAPK